MIRSQEVYEALLDDEAFALLPDRLAREYGARSTLFGWHFNRTDPAFLAHNCFFSQDAIDQYLLHFAFEDPWTLAHAQDPSPNQAVNLSEIVGADVWTRSRVFNEWLRPLGDDTVHCVGLYVSNAVGHGNLVMHRGKNQRPFDDDELREITAGGKHLRRLLSIKARLAAADLGGSVLRGFAEAAGPAILVSKDGRVLNSNSAGERLLRDGVLLKSAKGHLATSSATVPPLDVAIQKACSPVEPSAELVLLPRERRKPVTITVVPVSRPGPAVAMLLVDGADVSERGETVLAQRFGLSTAETDVAIRIARGQVIKEIAEERDASPQTVKVQIKSIMAKLDCSRQIEIAALVNAALRMASRVEQLNSLFASTGISDELNKPLQSEAP